MKLYEVSILDEKCGYVFKDKMDSNEIAMLFNEGKSIPSTELPIYKPTIEVPKQYSNLVFLRNILNDEIERMKNGTSNKETLGWIAENINDKLVGLKGR